MKKRKKVQDERNRLLGIMEALQAKLTTATELRYHDYVELQYNVLPYVHSTNIDKTLLRRKLTDCLELSQNECNELVSTITKIKAAL